jgi:hypothetical protein
MRLSLSKISILLHLFLIDRFLHLKMSICFPRPTLRMRAFSLIAYITISKVNTSILAILEWAPFICNWYVDPSLRELLITKKPIRFIY